jgi:uncharacterized damage-inducible protein DinB
MELREFFRQQLEREAAANRKVLERVPEGKNSWKPHERSMEIGYLAALVASMPAWIPMMIETDELNWDRPESQRFRAKPQDSTAALLKLAEESRAAADAALKKTNEGHLAKPWRFVLGGKVMAEAPRSEQIAGALSHIAHHRGQLTVSICGSTTPRFLRSTARRRTKGSAEEIWRTAGRPELRGTRRSP